MRYDVLVIGSGFGGSVTALRLAEKGYSVGVLEAGRRFADDEFPQTSWRLRRFLWAPRLGCYGLQRLTLLRPADRKAGGGVLVLSGAGVGGGSLVYANTLYEPLDAFYTDPQWRDVTDWRDELAGHYDQAKRMLGATTYPLVTRADRAMRAVADRMGVGHTHHATPVGVFIGRPGQRATDPYFGGAGPERTGCTHCGACMTGCRQGAKNTLVKNYLWLAERLGARVHPLTTVTAVRPAGDGGYAVHTVRTGAWLRARRQVIHADQVVFAAGALGTQGLLHAMKAEGALPALSPRLGELTRTNSEAILGASVPRRQARAQGLDFTEGVAITSSFHPDPQTHVEPVRYGRGSNAMGLLQSLLVDGGPRRVRRWLGILLRQPGTAARLLSVRGWSERTVIALVMQSVDNSLTTRLRRGPFGRHLVSGPGHGAPNPTWIPAGNQAARLLAEEIGGTPGGALTEPFDIPMTAHILGGAVIGATPADGVIDPWHRVFGHPGLHVVDGAAVSANLGVNPSLTITAQAERAMSFWPNRGDADPRPPLGEPYRRLEPVPPRLPAVPADAPGALRS
ncbi:GMC family oxidoreductase [Micromonospora sp. AMSO12t]|uniref:FAD-dependent oxidoreductase n=1 Tax=unclassified Micromonospora TaxID=2617518 RepID=UPI00124B1E0B|nr:MULTISPECIES: GMC family oxidoreductase [unclassified Micromonospora]KAB1140744.1 GMC family oxidoreductase [Micromonospora sp. AMSO12t]WSG02621.1 GMC family oxidoreductase [Micromonospora sp. NBC_01740]